MALDRDPAPEQQQEQRQARHQAPPPTAASAKQVVHQRLFTNNVCNMSPSSFYVAYSNLMEERWCVCALLGDCVVNHLIIVHYLWSV